MTTRHNRNRAHCKLSIAIKRRGTNSTRNLNSATALHGIETIKDKVYIQRRREPRSRSVIVTAVINQFRSAIYFSTQYQFSFPLYLPTFIAIIIASCIQFGRCTHNVLNDLLRFTARRFLVLASCKIKDCKIKEDSKEGQRVED